MTHHHSQLLTEIEAFLSRTGMGASYFGKTAVGNSELVPRLRSGGRIWPETEMKVRAFMLTRNHAPKRGDAPTAVQVGGGE